MGGTRLFPFWIVLLEGFSSLFDIGFLTLRQTSCHQSHPHTTHKCSTKTFLVCEFHELVFPLLLGIFLFSFWSHNLFLREEIRGGKLNSLPKADEAKILKKSDVLLLMSIVFILIFFVWDISHDIRIDDLQFHFYFLGRERYFLALTRKVMKI